MTINKWQIGALAATLAISATTVFAQASPKSLKVTIPFSFQAGPHRMLQPGEYRISRDGIVWTFTDTATSHQSLVPSMYSVPGKFGEEAKLVFVCQANDSACALRNIQFGSGDAGGAFPAPKVNKSDTDKTARLVVIPASLAR